MADGDDKWVTIQQAADRLNVSHQTVRSWIKAEKIASRKIKRNEGREVTEVKLSDDVLERTVTKTDRKVEGNLNSDSIQHVAKLEQTVAVQEAQLEAKNREITSLSARLTEAEHRYRQAQDQVLEAAELRGENSAMKIEIERLHSAVAQAQKPFWKR